MQDYRCYFLNERGHILFPADFRAGDWRRRSSMALRYCRKVHRHYRSPHERLRYGKRISCSSDHRLAKRPAPQPKRMFQRLLD